MLRNINERELTEKILKLFYENSDKVRINGIDIMSGISTMTLTTFDSKFSKALYELIEETD
jgi:hypothetical protein